MEETTILKVQQYLQMLKALQKSVERAIHSGVFMGTGRMAVKQYTGIQRKIAELFPEDFYVTDTLVLEIDEKIEEEHMLSQVQLAASQMVIYLEGLLREQRPAGSLNYETGDLRNLGRELQDQILRLTKSTISRALSNIEVDVNTTSYRDANLEGANLEGADFSGRNMKGATLNRANAQGANFTGVTLKEGSLEEGNFEGANFMGANMKNVHAANANFRGANLMGANLKDANLENVDFTGARLDGANLYGANLEGATLPQGEAFTGSGDLHRYNANYSPESTGKKRVHIEINTDDDDEGHVPPVPPVPPIPPHER